MPALIGTRRLALGLLMSTALAAAPVVPGVPALPSGADGLWVMSDYSTSARGTGITSGVVPNRMAATAPAKNLLSASRAVNANLTLNNNGLTYAEGATAADGSALAGKITWASGDQYSQFGIASLPAGTYTLSFDAIADDGTSTYSARIGRANLEGTVSIGPTWGRVTTTWTQASAAAPNLMLFRTVSGNTGSGAIRVDNVTLHQGSADLGADTLAGHLYMGLDAYRTAPGTATAGALDVSNGTGGIVQFPATKTLSAYTVVAIGARTTTSVSSGLYQSVLAKAGTSNYTAFAALMDLPSTSGGAAPANQFGGGQQISGDAAGLWLPRANEFHAITSRYGSGSASLFLDEAKTHNAASSGLTATVQSYWLSWLNTTGIYARYKYAAIALWPRALTDAEVRAAVANLKAEVAKGGVTVAPNPRFVVAEGDSITFGTGSNDGNGSYATRAGVNLSPAANGAVLARPNATLAGAAGSNSLQGRAALVDALIPADKASRLYVLTILIGRNDIAGYSGGVTQYITDLKTYAAARKAAGYDRIVLCTILPSTASTTPAFNTVRASFNSTIRAAGWAAANGFDAIVDFDTVSGMGADADASNTTNYGDGTHPTNTGYGLLEPTYRAAVNGLAP